MRRKLVLTLFVIASVLVLSVGVLILFLNPIVEGLRPQIEKAISDAVKQPVEVSSVKFQLVPRFAVEVRSVFVGRKAKGFSLSRVFLDARFLPLLARRLVVDTVRIEAPVITVRREPGGEIFIAEMPLKRRIPPASTESVPTDTVRHPEKSILLPLEVAEIQLANARLIWIDQTLSPPPQIEIRDLDVRVANVSWTESLHFSLTGSMLGLTPRNVKAEGNFEPASAASALPKGDATVVFENIDLERVQPLLQAYGVAKPGVAGVSNALAQLTANEEGQRAVLSIDATGAALMLPEQIVKDTNTPLQIEADIRLNPERWLTVKTLSVQIGGDKIELPFVMSPDGAISAQVESESFTLEPLRAFSPAAAKIGLAGSMASALRISGIRRGVRQLPQIRGTLSFQDVALTPSTGLSIAGLSGKLAFEKEKPTAVKLTATVTAAGGAPAEKANLEGAFDFASEKITLLPTTLTIFGGMLAGEGELSLSGAQPGRFSFVGKKFEVQRLFAALTPESVVTLGGSITTADAAVRFEAESIPQSLAAEASLTMNDGKIEGVNIFGSVVKKITELPPLRVITGALLPEKYRPLLNSADTPFDELRTSFSVAGASVLLDDLQLRHQLYSISAQGDLQPQLQIRGSLRLSPVFFQEILSAKNEGGLFLDRDGSRVVPFHLKKDGDSLIVLPDVSALSKQLTVGTVNKLLDTLVPSVLGK